MSRSFVPKVVTANRLREGDVVYMTASGDWTTHHSAALLIETEPEAQNLLAAAALQSLFVVGAYLADAKIGPSGPEPLHFREAFRTRGPSNYHHGKQADYAS